MKFEQPPHLNTETPKSLSPLKTEDISMIGAEENDDLGVKLSGVNRVILPAVSQHYEKSIERGFIDKSVSANIAEAEKQMPKELRESIEQINTLLVNFLRQWGLKESVSIKPENIVLSDIQSNSKEKARAKKALGEYHHDSSRIKMLTEWKAGNFKGFVKTLVHEMVHMQAFQSWDVNDSNILRQRRQGLRVRSKLDIPKNEDSFSWLDEAITETLTKRFIEAHEDDITILQGWRKPLVLAEKMNQKLSKIRNSDSYDGPSYFKQRKKLEEIIIAIRGKGGVEKYPTRDHVLQLFTSAALNGRLLPVARAIEKAYGKGTFKKLAALGINLKEKE